MMQKLSRALVACKVKNDFPTKLEARKARFSKIFIAGPYLQHQSNFSHALDPTHSINFIIQTAIMARRRTKKRTHVGASNGPSKQPTANAVSRSPKSMVIRIGASDVGPSVSQLVKDVRSMMEPDTAGRLKERRSNKLRDYVTMAGPLGVSHLLLFSRSTSGNTNMRLALTPRGPTLHFRVEKYSLCKDVRKALKHPKGGGKEYLNPPLVCFSPSTLVPSLTRPACNEQFHYLHDPRKCIHRHKEGSASPRTTYNHAVSVSISSHRTSKDTTLLDPPSHASESRNHPRWLLHSQSPPLCHHYKTDRSFSTTKKTQCCRKALA